MAPDLIHESTPNLIMSAFCFSAKFFWSWYYLFIKMLSGCKMLFPSLTTIKM